MSLDRINDRPIGRSCSDSKLHYKKFTNLTNFAKRRGIVYTTYVKRFEIYI
uniref:Uncharacterized protein n=1 Tax=Rhizophagus irregularis (strain DAOM 181602 / DAOM 197198 / MUCL 43194) TaxID=747089 RepID=U9UK41_RHIID